MVTHAIYITHEDTPEKTNDIASLTVCIPAYKRAFHFTKKKESTIVPGSIPDDVMVSVYTKFNTEAMLHTLLRSLSMSTRVNIIVKDRKTLDSLVELIMTEASHSDKTKVLSCGIKSMPERNITDFTIWGKDCLDPELFAGVYVTGFGKITEFCPFTEVPLFIEDRTNNPENYSPFLGRERLQELHTAVLNDTRVYQSELRKYIKNLPAFIVPAKKMTDTIKASIGSKYSVGGYIQSPYSKSFIKFHEMREGKRVFHLELNFVNSVIEKELTIVRYIEESDTFPEQQRVPPTTPLPEIKVYDVTIPETQIDPVTLDYPGIVSIKNPITGIEEWYAMLAEDLQSAPESIKNSRMHSQKVIYINTYGQYITYKIPTVIETDVFEEAYGIKSISITIADEVIPMPS